MTDLTTTDALHYAKDRAISAWYQFMREANLRAIIPDWRTGITPDGAPSLTVEVVGPGAAYALRRFAADFPISVGLPGDQRPQLDYSVRGRTACVWRKYGVWVELWHADTVPAAPVPSPAGRRLLLRPGGRLPFTRNRRTLTAKETTTR